MFSNIIWVKENRRAFFRILFTSYYWCRCYCHELDSNVEVFKLCIFYFSSDIFNSTVFNVVNLSYVGTYLSLLLEYCELFFY